MINTTRMLRNELKDYANPTARIRQLVKKGALVPVVRGIYETDRGVPGHYLAQVIYGPSYLSFEFALAYYSLIPEAVYNYPSATFEKRKAKRYDTPFGTFTYRDIPSEAYPVGVMLHMEEGYSFQIASPEKAICDQLYIMPPMRNRKELEYLLFEDLRIDEGGFSELNMAKLMEIAACFRTKNHKLLQSYVRRGLRKGAYD